MGKIILPRRGFIAAAASLPAAPAIVKAENIMRVKGVREALTAAPPVVFDDAEIIAPPKIAPFCTQPRAFAELPAWYQEYIKHIDRLIERDKFTRTEWKPYDGPRIA